MKKIKIFVFLILIAITLFSCVAARVINYESIAREPKPNNFPIEICESNNLSREYKVIGLVTANAGKFHSTEDTIETLKQAAREMGGDALLDVGFATSDGKIIQPLGSGYMASNPRENWGAKVIIWTKQETNKIAPAIQNPSISEKKYDYKIRIIKENAALKIKPNEESQSILMLPMGAIFEVEEQVGGWIKIKLPPNKDGIIITGYVHESLIEYEKREISL